MVIETELDSTIVQETPNLKAWTFNAVVPKGIGSESISFEAPSPRIVGPTILLSWSSNWYATPDSVDAIVTEKILFSQSVDVGELILGIAGGIQTTTFEAEWILSHSTDYEAVTVATAFVYNTSIVVSKPDIVQSPEPSVIPVAKLPLPKYAFAPSK